MTPGLIRTQSIYLNELLYFLQENNNINSWRVNKYNILLSISNYNKFIWKSIKEKKKRFYIEILGWKHTNWNCYFLSKNQFWKLAFLNSNHQFNNHQIWYSKVHKYILKSYQISPHNKDLELKYIFIDFAKC